MILFCGIESSAQNHVARKMLTAPFGMLSNKAFAGRSSSFVCVDYMDSIFPNETIAKRHDLEYIFLSVISEQKNEEDFVEPHKIKKLKIDAELMAQLQNIKFIEIAGMEIEGSLSPFFQLKGLLGISLMNCGIIDAQLLGCDSRSCSYLDLSYNQLSNVETIDSIKFPSLKTLIVGNNHIKFLDASQLDHIQTLYFANRPFGMNHPFLYMHDIAWPNYGENQIFIADHCLKFLELIESKQVKEVSLAYYRVSELDSLCQSVKDPTIRSIRRLRKLHLYCRYPIIEYPLVRNNRIRCLRCYIERKFPKLYRWTY